MSSDRADVDVNSVSRDGLRKMKEVADAMQTLDEPNLRKLLRLRRTIVTSIRPRRKIGPTGLG